MPKREIRAVWLTTIGGLDWPGRYAHGGQDTLRQQQELCRQLDRLAAARINTVLLQTRIRSTVIYPSQIEAWDGCLSGKPGVSPGYDALAFAVRECHLRGLELHAWMVAFPACSQTVARQLGNQALPARQPALCKKAGDHWYLDPGVPETADYLTRLCREVAERYDIDGLHLDYIRYPEKEVPFDDAATWRRYGGGQEKASWRRGNVTRCVQSIYAAVKAVKPWLKVSCSPLGKHEDLSRFPSRGWNAYHTTSQDAQGWLRSGTMDIVFPMLYFDGNHFYPFVYDWQEQAAGRLVVGGLGAYLLSERGWPLSVLRRQTLVSRSAGLSGQAYFRARFLLDNVKGVYHYLQRELYPFPALAPALTWQDAQPPAPPAALQLRTDRAERRVSWQPPAIVKAGGVRYNLYRSAAFPVDISDAQNLYRARLTACSATLPLVEPQARQPVYYALTAMDRYGNESEAVPFNRPSERQQPPKRPL